MSESTKSPPQEPEKPREPSPSEQPGAQTETFHPHRHGHIAIHPASTGVTHLDPGVVTFSN